MGDKTSTVCGTRHKLAAGAGVNNITKNHNMLALLMMQLQQR